MEAEKRFWGPGSVRVDGAGRLYVVEHSRHRVQTYKRTCDVLTLSEKE